MLDVLIISDNQFRDISSNKLLAGYLKKQKLKVKIFSKVIYRTAIDTLNPQVVIVPRITDDFNDIFELKKKRGFKLIFIPCEHGAGNEFRILAFIKSYAKKNFLDNNYKKKLENIDKIFVPSDYYKKVLLDNNLFEDNKISVSGTLNSDLWFKNSNKLFLKMKNNSEKTIGIATSFKSFMFTSNYESIQKAIYTINSFKKKGENNFENQKEDLYFLLHEMYQFMIISKIIQDNKNINFSLRVHPGENIKNIKSLIKKVKNISIDRSPILKEWISNQKLILTFSSTLLYDAYYSEVPILSLSKLVPHDLVDIVEDVKKPLNTDFVYRPDNFDELYKKINSEHINFDEIFDLNNKIKIESQSFKNFNFPRKKIAFKEIGDEILSLVKDKKKNFLKKFILNLKIIIINLKQIKAANFLFKHSFVLSDKIYNPLNLINNIKTDRYVKLILEKIKN
jgi:surface carbohydrate biosynthesis protein